MLARALAFIPDAFAFQPANRVPRALRREKAPPIDVPERGVEATRPAGLSIALENVSKSFGPHQVLQGIDLTVRAGEFVAIVGRSGCGKSTLLRLMVGLEEPTSGEVQSHSSTEADVPAGTRRIMFQEPRLLPWARVIENVEVGLGGGGTRTERHGRAAEALARVALADRAHEWPAVLSGGQRQRVALARALVSRPGLLALDEPLGALDALTRIEMQTLIEEVWLASRFTAVLVTHDVSEAVALADRILVIDDGRIALDLPVEAPRPRRRGEAALATLEGRILDHLFYTRRASVAGAAS